MKRYKISIKASVMLALFVTPLLALSDDSANQYLSSPNITMMLGNARTSATNYDNAGYFQFLLTKPITDTKYALNIGWMNLTQFDHTDIQDTGLDSKAFVLGVSRKIYQRKRLSILAGLQSLAYTSETTFLNKRIGKERAYTWGPSIRSSINLKHISFDAGIDWYKNISESEIYVFSLGMTFKLGPIFRL